MAGLPSGPSNERRRFQMFLFGRVGKEAVRPMLLILGILAGCLGSIYFSWSRLIDIELALPVTIAKQERDLALLVQDASDMAWQVKLAGNMPSQSQIQDILNRIAKLEARLEMIRNSYNFDNLVGASAMHAVINPALVDINLWLTEGVYGLAPDSPAVMALVETRATNAINTLRPMFAEASRTVADTLLLQSQRIQSFRLGIVVFLIMLTVISAVAIVQMYRLKKIDQALRVANEALKRASRAKSEFLANMSHELRTPLNAVIGFSQIMSDGLFGEINNPKYREYISDIRDSSQHLLEVISDILDISKIEAEEIDLEEDELEIQGIIAASMRLVRLRGETKHQHLSVDIPPDIPRLRADGRLVRQILANLLSNSIKFTPEGGDVTVHAGLDERGGMVLSVEDTGIGIAPEDIPKVLEPFGQVRDHPELAHEGTGLGLSLSKKLLELHGGTLSIESRLGKGTTMKMTFPPDRTIHSQSYTSLQ